MGCVMKIESVYGAILVAIYALQRKFRVHYRNLAAYLYIADRIVGLGVIKKVFLVPGGAESLFVNGLLMLLYAHGYVLIDRGEITLTKQGKELVKEILRNTLISNFYKGLKA